MYVWFYSTVSLFYTYAFFLCEVLSRISGVYTVFFRIAEGRRYSNFFLRINISASHKTAVRANHIFANYGKATFLQRVLSGHITDNAIYHASVLCSTTVVRQITLQSNLYAYAAIVGCTRVGLFVLYERRGMSIRLLHGWA